MKRRRLKPLKEGSSDSSSTKKRTRTSREIAICDQFLIQQVRMHVTLLRGTLPDRRLVFTHQVQLLFCVKLRHGRHLETMT